MTPADRLINELLAVSPQGIAARWLIDNISVKERSKDPFTPVSLAARWVFEGVTPKRTWCSAVHHLHPGYRSVMYVSTN